MEEKYPEEKYSERFPSVVYDGCCIWWSKTFEGKQFGEEIIGEENFGEGILEGNILEDGFGDSSTPKFVETG